MRSKSASAGDAGAAGMRKLSDGVNAVSNAAAKNPGKKLADDLRQAESAAGVLDSRVRSFASMMLSAGGLSTIGIAAGAALGYFTGQAIQAADEIYNVSLKTGISASDLSKLQFAAKQADASLDDVTIAFRGMSRQIDEALRSNRQAEAAFARLGISIDDLKHKSSTDLFIAIADGLAKIKDGNERAAVAQLVMGRAALQLLPLLHDLANGGFAELSKEAERAGVVISDDMAKAADQFHDNLEKLKASFHGIFIGIANEVLPSLNALTDFLLNKYSEATDDAAKSTKKLGVEAEAQASKVDMLTKAVVAYAAAHRIINEIAKSIPAIAAGGTDAYANKGLLDLAGKIKGVIDEAKRAVAGNPPLATADNKSGDTTNRTPPIDPVQLEKQQEFLRVARDQYDVVKSQLATSQSLDEIEKMRLDHATKLLQVQKEVDRAIASIPKDFDKATRDTAASEFRAIGALKTRIENSDFARASAEMVRQKAEEVAESQDAVDLANQQLKITQDTVALDAIHQRNAQSVYDVERETSLMFQKAYDEHRAQQIQLAAEQRQAMNAVPLLDPNRTTKLQNIEAQYFARSLEEWTKYQSQVNDIYQKSLDNREAMIMQKFHAADSNDPVMQLLDLRIKKIVDRFDQLHDDLNRTLTDATDTLFESLATGHLSEGLGSVANSFAAQLSRVISSKVGDWLTELNRKAAGLELLDKNGNPISGTAPTAGQQRLAQAGLAGIQGAAALYGLYQNGQNGASRGQNALSGAVEGATIGSKFGVTGAIVGGVVGAIAGFLTGSKSKDTTPYGKLDVVGGQAYFGLGKNVSAGDIEDFKRSAEETVRTVWNAYTNVLLKLPASVLQNIDKLTIGGPLGDSKVINDWLAHTLKDGIRQTFEAALKTGFTAAGLSSNAFDKFLEETNHLSAEDAAKFWSDLADGLESFRNARERMKNLSAIPDLGLARFDQNGFAQPLGKSDFELQIRSASKGIFDIAKQMVSLTGPDRVAAFKQLGASVDQVTKSLADYLSRIGNALKSIKQTFDSAFLEMQLSQYDQKTDDSGNVIREANKNAQARLLEAEYDKKLAMIQNAKQLGLSPEEVSQLSSSALDLLTRIYNLDPSDEAYKWWQGQAQQLQAMSDQSLQALGDAAKSAVNELIGDLQPFVDWFNGLPVDLDAALRNITDDSLPGFADAIDALAQRIRNVDLTPPGTGTPPDGGGKPGDGGRPGPGDGTGDDKGKGVVAITVNVNGPTYGVQELTQTVFDAVTEAITANPNVIDSTYAATG